jgi:hypothetical protein
MSSTLCIAEFARTGMQRIPAYTHPGSTIFVLFFFLRTCSAGGELLQEGLPDAQVYKAFNTIGTSLMKQPDALGRPISMMFGRAGRARQSAGGGADSRCGL